MLEYLICSLIMRQSIRNKCVIFSRTARELLVPLQLVPQKKQASECHRQVYIMPGTKIPLPQLNSRLTAALFVNAELYFMKVSANRGYF